MPTPAVLGVTTFDNPGGYDGGGGGGTGDGGGGLGNGEVTVAAAGGSSATEESEGAAATAGAVAVAWSVAAVELAAAAAMEADATAEMMETAGEAMAGTATAVDSAMAWDLGTLDPTQSSRPNRIGSQSGTAGRTPFRSDRSNGCRRNLQND